MARPGFVTSLIMLAGGALVAWALSRPPEEPITGVADVIDGDSLRIAGEEIRLKGMDAPELMQTCTVARREEPCGRQSRQALRRLAGSGLVTCVGSGRDRYGRRLAYCRVRGIDVGATMVREGQAVSLGAYAREEEEARGAYRGVWAGTFERPSDWRARHPRGVQGS